jgi:aminoglycoside 6'-N-acetyltransferase
MQDGELRLRKLTVEEAPALHALLADPAVARWWIDGSHRADSGWAIEVDGALAGWLEHHEEDYHWYPSVAFDIALAASLHGQGYGRRALALAVEHFRAKGHHRFTVDPNAANERAIRCYRSLGFREVGTLRAYERDPEGGWSDALLMELVLLPDTGGAPVDSAP